MPRPPRLNPYKQTSIPPSNYTYTTNSRDIEAGTIWFYILVLILPFGLSWVGSLTMPLTAQAVLNWDMPFNIFLNWEWLRKAFENTINKPLVTMGITSAVSGVITFIVCISIQLYDEVSGAEDFAKYVVGMSFCALAFQYVLQALPWIIIIIVYIVSFMLILGVITLVVKIFSAKSDE